MQHLTLAAAQITCQDGKMHENLARATQMAEQAQNQGAQLVLFPEFMPQGYLLTPALWDSAELFDGPTTHWLAESARDLGIYLGTSFLEARNGISSTPSPWLSLPEKFSVRRVNAAPRCGKPTFSRANMIRPISIPTLAEWEWASASTIIPTNSPASSSKATLI